MNIIKTGKIHFKSPKGFGILKYKNEKINFTNAITIFGKAHIHNAILFHMHNLAGSNTGSGHDVFPVPLKPTGISILCRRTHSNATNVNAMYTKSLFEVNVVKGSAIDSSKSFAMTNSNLLMPGNSNPAGQGHDVDVANSVIHYQVGTGDEKLTVGTENTTDGIWGDATMDSGAGSGELYDSIWDGGAGLLGNQNPYNEGVGLVASEAVLSKARIIGISLIIGGDYDNWTDDSSGGYIHSKKVWRDPSYLQLLHDQEASRNDYGLTSDGSGTTYGSSNSSVTDGDGNTPGVIDLTSAGHYYPSKISGEDASVGTDPTRLESQGAGADVWEWKHVAHDTFAHTFFATHWYASQAGAVSNPYGTGSISNLHKLSADDNGGGTSLYDALTAHQVYTHPPAGGINLIFKDETASAEGGGDSALPQAISLFEVDYNTGAIAVPDHLIDANDQISARYSIDFTHTAHTFDINTELGDVANIINVNLSKSLASDFGNADDAWSESAGTTCAFTHVRLYDNDGHQMQTKDINPNQFNEGNAIPIGNVRHAFITPIDLKCNEASGFQGETEIVLGSASYADENSTRPRVLQTTIQLKFDNVKKNTTHGTSQHANFNPSIVKFYNGQETSDELFQIRLMDSSSASLHNTQNPLYDQGDSANFDDFKDGVDLPYYSGTPGTGFWEDENNLIVNLTVYTG